MTPKSVIVEPTKFASTTGPGDFIISLATVADGIIPWGQQPAARDRQLRSFWPTEPILASAIYSTASRYAAFGWTLDGPKGLVKTTQLLFQGFERGEGWIPLLMKTLIDLFTQDNGAFLEVVRTANSPDAPMVTLNHLDANRCVRTGRHEEPVIYYDSVNQAHILKWYQVIALSEMPSPIEYMRGMQYCVVTRMLRAAQILRDISVYKSEKISGRFAGAVHLVGGVQGPTIEAALKREAAKADSQGQTRYILPLIIASLDPTANVTATTLLLASLPEGFNEETTMKWYINQLALAFGGDYQDFAPLPGGGLGSAEQSETLLMKSRGKGPRLFMSMMEQIINFRGILPRLVSFMFGVQDTLEDTSTAELRKIRAQERDIRIKNNELSPQVARQIAVDAGDLDPRYLPELAADDEKRAAQAAAIAGAIANANANANANTGDTTPDEQGTSVKPAVAV